MLANYLLNNLAEWRPLSKGQRRYVCRNFIDRLPGWPRSRWTVGYVAVLLIIGMRSLRHIGIGFEQRLMAWGILILLAVIHQAWSISRNRSEIAAFIRDHENELGWIAKAAEQKKNSSIRDDPEQGFSGKGK